jgi:K+-sensing histidine kinase KdpD
MPPSTERLTLELHALTEVSKTITTKLEMPQLLEAIMDKLIGVLEPAEVGAVMLWDQSVGLFRPAATFGYDLEILKGIGLQAGESVTGKVFDEGKACLWSTPEEVAQAMEDMRPANWEVMSRSLGVDELPLCTLAAPISVEHQKYGVLVLETLEGPAEFTENDLPFVQSLADLIALAIDRARLEAKADAVREAREAERLRSELMATLSHEMRLPLSSIKGYATALLLDEVEWSEEKRTEFLRQIDEECDNLQVVLTDIVDSSLIELEQLSIEPEPVRLHYVANEISAEMQRRTDKHHIVVDLSVDIPIVKADPHWIRQVFRNVLDNALKYSPDGGLVVIRGEARPSDVVVSVADQGIGISPEDLIPLFEKYFRVKSPSVLHVPGMGLGLPIARAIVEAHGGRIWVESKEGEGTMLSFSIPRWILPEFESEQEGL